MRRRFVTLDVFTQRRFAGNPLAVVLDAGGIDGATMQAVAREFGHPETVFVLAFAERRARIRIFTPVRELPFAGHPTVGTALLLGGQAGLAAGDELVLEEGIGPVRCTVEAGGQARFALPQLPARDGEAAAAAELAAALSLAPADIGFGRLRPSRWSAGLPCTLVPVASLTAVARARPDLSRFEAAFGEAPVYVFCAESIDPAHDFHARMFAPALGVPEDPATGSAAAAFAGLYAAEAGLADGAHTLAIEQGYEMGRPSLIRLTLTIASGRLHDASIGGAAVVVTEGTIEA
jgi:trans-2,3-dihydro-3-hydroxyanthranilate isomerase